MFRKSLSLTVVVIVILSVYIFGCAEDKDEKVKKAQITYNISGRVVDNSGLPISDAIVKYTFGTEEGQAATDAGGVYTLSNLELGVYTIDATKTGYTFGRTYAVVSGNGSIVSDVTLKNLTVIEDRVELETTADAIKTSTIDIEITTETDATLSLGGTVTEQKKQTVSASIPGGTEIKIGGVVPTEPVILSVAPLEVNEIPPPPPAEMPIGAAVFEPQNATFDKPVTVKVPVDIKLPSGISIPLKKFVDGVWEEVGTATIDDTGLGADADVTEFGQLAVQPEVEITTEIIDTKEEIESTEPIPKDETSIEVEITESVSFPGGLPEGITEEYALALIQKLEGITQGSKIVKIYLPEVETVTAKPASPLAANKTEPYVTTCTLVKKLLTTQNETVLHVLLADGGFLNFPITWEHETIVLEPDCEITWQEHYQGESETP